MTAPTTLTEEQDHEASALASKLMRAIEGYTAQGGAAYRVVMNEALSYVRLAYLSGKIAAYVELRDELRADLKVRK